MTLKFCCSKLAVLLAVAVLVFGGCDRPPRSRPR